MERYKNKDEILSLIEKGLKRKDIAKEFNIHLNLLYYWMLKLGIIPMPIKLCKKCGQDNPSMFHPDKHTICRKCRRNSTTVKKQQMVAYKGGKCERCGYDRCHMALDFHHKDPKEKEAQWRTLRYQKKETIFKELDKCSLLCKNCHTEVHWEWNRER